MIHAQHPLVIGGSSCLVLGALLIAAARNHLIDSIGTLAGGGLLFLAIILFLAAIKAR